jgi:hypothetical protein
MFFMSYQEEQLNASHHYYYCYNYGQHVSTTVTVLVRFKPHEAILHGRRSGVLPKADLPPPPPSPPASWGGCVRYSKAVLQDTQGAT